MMMWGRFSHTGNLSHSVQKPCGQEGHCEGESSSLNDVWTEQAGPSTAQLHTTPKVALNQLDIGELAETRQEYRKEWRNCSRRRWNKENTK